MTQDIFNAVVFLIGMTIGGLIGPFITLYLMDRREK